VNEWYFDLVDQNNDGKLSVVELAFVIACVLAARWVFGRYLPDYVEQRLSERKARHDASRQEHLVSQLARDTVENVARTALTDPDPVARASAVRVTSDPNVLAQVVIGDRDREIARIAAEKLREYDQATLPQAALIQACRGTRHLEAVAILLPLIENEEVMTELMTLNEFLPTDREPFYSHGLTGYEQIKIVGALRREAVLKVTDPEKLERYAADQDPFVKAVAARKLDRQFVLDAMLIAESAKEREAAVSQVTDAEVLRTLALHDRSEDVRRAALTNLKCQETLRRIAVADEDQSVRNAAAERLRAIRMQTRSL
jgi:hypothetical protein